MTKKTFFMLAVVLALGAFFAFPYVKFIPGRMTGSSANLEEIRHRVRPYLSVALSDIGLELGRATFIRVFKEERQLEVWLKGENSFQLFKSYEICNFSGALGPKLKEGDRQSPEGFYTVNRAAMNPNSSYHLSFNLGFPNLFDQAHSRTGSFLMIHGNCVSIGCYAMTNESIEEIFLIVEAAHAGGQAEVPVHAFPFRMTPERLAMERENTWFAYWKNLQIGYDQFEAELVPPTVSVLGREYIFGSGS